MISDAFVTVECDECGEAEKIQLTALSRGGYDMRNVAGELESLGWKKAGDKDICPNHEDEKPKRKVNRK